MSTPIEPTIPQTVALASLDELRTQAGRLGLTWDLIAGTVVETSTAFTARVPRVQLDGDVDGTGITAVAFTQPVAVGMRVMIMFVPPLGYYIVGLINPDDTQRYEIGALTNHGTGLSTTEVILETFTQFKVLSGAAYRLEIDGWILAASTTFTYFRLRKTNLAGLSLNASDVWPGIGFGQAPFRHVGYFKNITGDTIVTDLVLTGLTTTSTSTWGADAERPRYVSIQYAGPAVEYPSAVAIA